MKHYKNFEEYFNANNSQELEELKDEFRGQLNNGFIQDLTLGTYNGATNTFTTRELNTCNLNEAILIYIHEMELEKFLIESYNDSMENNGEPLETDNTSILIEEFLCNYNIFTVGNNIYVNLN